MSYANYCPLEGGQLYYELTGEGEALVLIHAGITHLRMWDEQVKAFAKHYKVICYDLRTQGKSSSEAVAFSHHQDLDVLLNHLNISRAHLCGISMGGKVALEYALSYPEKVSSLIMTATGLINGSEQSEQEKQLFAEMDALEEAGDWYKVAEIDLRLFVDGPTSPEGRAAEVIRKKVKDMALANYLSYYKNHPTQDSEPQALGLVPPAQERVRELKIPGLTMVGDLDTSRALTTSDLFAREIPGAKQVIIKDTAHLPSMEKPGVFNKHVLEFLAAL